LLASLACNLFISFGCIYFGKCRKECRCQRVADSPGETTATLGCVSELRGSHDHHLLRYGNNAFLRDGRKVNLFKTAHRAILLCLDFLAASRAGPPRVATEFHLARVRQRAFVVLGPHQIPRIDPAVARRASEKLFDFPKPSPLGALAEYRPARSRFIE
jgi:hypothetical protein